MEISGNSKQETRSGKNLFIPIQEGTNAGITITKNKDGTYNIAGTSTANIEWTKFINLDKSKIENGSTYILSSTKVLPEGLSSRVEMYNDTAWLRPFVPSINSTTTTNIGVANTSDTTRIRFGIFIASGVTVNIKDVGFQLELGSTASTYEQYGVSPSPDYPSEIKAVGDNVNLYNKDTEVVGRFIIYTGIETINSGWTHGDYIEVKNNKKISLTCENKVNGQFGIAEYDKDKKFLKLNFYDFINSTADNKYTITTSNTTKYIIAEYRNNLNITNIKVVEGTEAGAYSKYGQGCVKVTKCNKNISKYKSFTSTSSARIVSDTTTSGQQVEGTKIKKGKTYTISFDVTGLPSIDYRIQIKECIDKNVTQTSGEIPNIIQNEALTCNTLKRYSKIVTAYGDNYLYIRCVPNGFVLDNIQIEENSESTPYEEHQEQSYIMPTQQPMRSVGNIRDTFIKTNGKWYERHYIARKILDGTEDWSANVNAQFELTGNKYPNYKKNNEGGTCISSHYRYSLTLDTCIWIGNYSFIIIRNPTYKTVEEFKTYLKSQYDAGTPVYVDYILETPTDIECTEEQNKVLEELTYATTYEGTTHIYSSDEISPKLKTTVGSEIVPIGQFIIQKPDSEEVKEKTTFTGYDHMSKFDVTYVDDEIYPIKLYDKLNNLCKQVGVELGTKEIINGDYEISGNPFTNNETCKTVLSNIAQLACGFAKIGRDNKLYIIALSNKENIAETLDANCYMDDFSKNDIWGEVNSLIIRLSQVEGENTTIQDEESIQKNGLTEITISDNYFLKDSAEREKVIQAIWKNIKGLKYLPFSTTYYGFPYLDVGDMLKIADTKDNEYVSYVFNHEFAYNGSFTGTLETKALTKTQTALKNTNNIKTKFRNVELKVDKIDGKITSIIEQQTDTENKLTQAQQDIEGFTQKVATKDELTEKVNEIKHTIDNITLQQQTKGGGNIFFYAKEYWRGQTQDSEATLEEYTHTLIQQNNISDEGYLINKGVSIQSQVVKNGQYVISFNYYKLKADATGYVKINEIEYKLDGNVNTWTEKIIPIEVTSNNIKIEIGSDTDASFYIADLMVAVGTEKSVWTQNANETRTDTVEIGKGIQVNSSTKNTYTRIDADGNRTFNSSTNERVAEMTDKGVYTKQLEVKEQAIINSLLIQEVSGQIWITGIGG